MPRGASIFFVGRPITTVSYRHQLSPITPAISHPAISHTCLQGAKRYIPGVFKAVAREGEGECVWKRLTIIGVMPPNARDLHRRFRAPLKRTLCCRWLRLGGEWQAKGRAVASLAEVGGLIAFRTLPNIVMPSAVAT